MVARKLRSSEMSLLLMAKSVIAMQCPFIQCQILSNNIPRLLLLKKYLALALIVFAKRAECMTGLHNLGQNWGP